MSGTELEEIFCGNFFDQIDDALDFPNDHAENELLDDGIAMEYNNFPPVFLSENSPVFSSANSNITNSASDFTAELSVPYEDIVQFKWFSGSENLKSSTKDSFRNQCQTCYSISVHERSAFSERLTLPISHAKRARSKRPRPATFKPRPCLIITQTPKKRRKNKIKRVNENPNANPTSQEPRKCLHCEITQTPQWRAGPMGPKTLCNACGVRYKSGRLFPEYRPAASPTFVPSLHSNSHKKVLEMRTKNINGKCRNS